MINKLLLQALINKYHLGINESVKWEIIDKNLEINFISPTKDVVGKIRHKNFPLEDCTLAIFETKKLLNLVNICEGDLLISLEKNHLLATKLNIEDKNFKLIYSLSDLLLIGKVATVDIPEWDLELELTVENLNNLIKAHNASDSDNLIIKTSKNELNEEMWEFAFGNASTYSNRIIHSIFGKTKNLQISLPFNSELIRNILYFNRDMEVGYLYLNEKGLIKFEFKVGDSNSEYYIVRKQEGLI